MSDLVVRTSSLEKTPESAVLNGSGPSPSGMTTRDYVKVLFRQKGIIFLTILTVCLATYVGLQFKTPVYQAEVKMLITAQKQIESPYYRDSLNERNIDPAITQSEIVKSKPVLERAIAALALHKRPLDFEKHFATPLRQILIDWQVKRLHLDKYPVETQEGISYRYTMADLMEHIKVEPVRDSSLFAIKVQDFSPVGAAIIANAISRSYVIFDLEQQYVELQNKYTEKNPIVLQMKENIIKMEKGLSGQPLPNIEAIGPASVKIIEQATPPLKPLGLPRKLTLVLAVIMSIFLGLFMAFMFEYMDQSFHSKQDLENFVGAPVIACINKKKRLGERVVLKDVSDANKSPRAVSYRILTSQILFLIKTKGLRSLCFTSVHPNDESGPIVANLALFLSRQMKLKTLVIDSNLRKPQLHKVFKAPQDDGIGEVLEGGLRIEDAIRPIEEKLDFISSGRSAADPGILLDQAAFSKLLSNVKSIYDVVLVDSALLRDFRDTPVIAPAFDGVILIVGESTVRRQVVAHSVKHLRDHHSKIAGVIMPNREYLLPKFLYESV